MVSGVSLWLRGPAGNNGHDGRSGGVGRGGGDVIGSGKKDACLCVSSLHFFPVLKLRHSLCTIKKR